MRVAGSQRSSPLNWIGLGRAPLPHTHSLLAASGQPIREHLAEATRKTSSEPASGPGIDSRMPRDEPLKVSFGFRATKASRLRLDASLILLRPGTAASKFIQGTLPQPIRARKPNQTKPLFGSNLQTKRGKKNPNQQRGPSRSSRGLTSCSFHCLPSGAVWRESAASKTTGTDHQSRPSMHVTQSHLPDRTDPPRQTEAKRPRTASGIPLPPTTTLHVWEREPQYYTHILLWPPTTTNDAPRISPHGPPSRTTTAMTQTPSRPSFCGTST